MDQLSDAVTHRFRRMRLAAARRRNRRGEEIFQLEDAPVRGHVLVCSHARDRRLVHSDCIRYGLEVERSQMLDAVSKKTVLLSHDLSCHFKNGLCPLIERSHEPCC